MQKKKITFKSKRKEKSVKSFELVLTKGTRVCGRGASSSLIFASLLHTFPSNIISASLSSPFDDSDEKLCSSLSLVIQQFRYLSWSQWTLASTWASTAWVLKGWRRSIYHGDNGVLKHLGGYFPCSLCQNLHLWVANSNFNQLSTQSLARQMGLLINDGTTSEVLLLHF